MDGPVFAGFVRKDGSVKAGKIAMNAYDTPAYAEFTNIVDDLIKMADGGGSKGRILQELSAKIRRLAARLK
jgi:hypothetical protein